MEKYGIPTARAGTFTDFPAASRFAASLGGRCAVKADGLALGKGVLICRDMAQADHAIEEVLVKKSFGAAGANIVIQELLEGMEISLHALCDGRTAKLFPTAQDHKRALDGDRGLNTGGMGAYSPTPFLSDAELAEAGRRILDPWLRGCAAEGIDFHGILYPGVMLTKDGPKVLEFNARFGDPETQVYLTRLENDLAELLVASVRGTPREHGIEVEPDAFGVRRDGLRRLSGQLCQRQADPGTGRGGPSAKHEGLPRRHRQGRGPNRHCRWPRAGRDRLGEGLAQRSRRRLCGRGTIRFEGAQFRRDIAGKALR